MTEPDDIIRGFWKSRAALNTPEAARFHTGHTPFDQEILATLCKPGDRILDLGCGTCVIANWLVTERGARVHGVDSQAEFLSFAAPHEAMTVEQADLRSYQPRGTYDGVLIFGVINHLPVEAERDDLYRRIVGSLSPGGFVLIKCQFGVDSPVEVNTYSEALGGPYYSVYPGLAAEVDLLLRRLDTRVLDLYPPELSPHSNTHFYHLLGTKRD